MMELKHIGRYDIKSLIGQGGMSAVYLGYDPRSQREVAIKILPPYYLHAPKFRERFDREALTIALLEHPAIVPVYDMGEEDGQPYIVMRYMSGGSLAEKLKNGPIMLRECMEMYLRLAPALDTAHARGIIHRDLKPDNLLFDKYNNVFLSDFGLARLRETIGFANISDGSILGTPAYMSPEQIQGDREIDGHSDIYSMGVMLYHMLCGSVPFNGPTAASVMMMHLINPVPQIHDQNKSLPIAIQAVLEKAMAKNPKDRYQTVGEFAKAIQAATTGVHKRISLKDLPATSVNQEKKRPNFSTPAPAYLEPSAQNRLLTEKPVHVGSGNVDSPTGPRMHGARGTIVYTAISKLQNAFTLYTQPTSVRKTLLSIPQWAWVFSVVIVLSLSLTLIQWFRGGFPFSILSGPGSSSPPGNISSRALGQADKLAFLNGSNIWASNLDGSNLVQLTTDGSQKSHLHWSVDGSSVLFTTTDCLYSVNLETKQTSSLTCFNNTPINSFDISRNGQEVALGLGSSDLYLFPYAQLFHLRPASLPEELASLAQCSYYSPYHLENAVKAMNWSLSADHHLALLLSKAENGVTRDEIQVLDFSRCAPAPAVVREILPAYLLFTLPGYYDNPQIHGFAFNSNQVLMNNNPTQAGFGDLELINLDQNQSQKITPNGSCCYRDAYWSPDGTYLFYTFQPQAGGDISLYYTPVSMMNQPGTQPTSLSLPTGFFASNLESLQPALRTAH